MEEWRDIKGYEGRYLISSLGRVYSHYKKDCLSPGKNPSGYLYVILFKEGKGKPYTVHKLVAVHFISNPNNYKEVNHKDENKENNYVSNLEWCDRKYNCNYGTRNKRTSESMKGKVLTEEHKNKMSESTKGSKNPRARKVQCITTKEIFNCIKEAEDFYDIAGTDITKCCRGKRKSAGKHPVTGEKLKWRYIDDK